MHSKHDQCHNYDNKTRDKYRDQNDDSEQSWVLANERCDFAISIVEA